MSTLNGGIMKNILQTSWIMETPDQSTPCLSVPYSRPAPILFAAREARNNGGGGLPHFGGLNPQNPHLIRQSRRKPEMPKPLNL